MKPLPNARPVSNGQCLSDMDLYNYLTRKPGQRSLAELESHVSTCAHCLNDLAELIKVLHPEPGHLSESTPEVSRKEIQETLELIQKVTRRESQTAVRAGLWRSRYRWALAATAALVIAGLALWGVELWRDMRRSGAFYAQAKVRLREVYSPQSPSGLRLNLPFESAVVRGDPSSEEALGTAENLFYQSLAIREGLTGAHLGLGYIYLRKAQFSKAEGEFQKAVESAPNDSQTLLSRGVALYENGLASNDPVFRSSCLKRALADFDRILQKDPTSSEARFNKCLTLYEAGRHGEALREIEGYFSYDSASKWAERLKVIQIRIRMSNSSAIEQEVDRALQAKDTERLETLARTVPYQMPEVIRKMLRQSLEVEDPHARIALSSSSDLRWAVEILDSVYGTVTGDKSHQRLLKFCVGLSPPQRRAKRMLDARFQELVDLHKKGELSAVLRASRPLEEELEKLHDQWQLTNLHHLRGNCFYYNQADFDSALVEYHEMLHCAERSGSPDLIAGALGASAAAYLAKSRFDDARGCIARMQEIARTFTSILGRLLPPVL